MKHRNDNNKRNDTTPSIKARWERRPTCRLFILAQKAEEPFLLRVLLRLCTLRVRYTPRLEINEVACMKVGEQGEMDTFSPLKATQSCTCQRGAQRSIRRAQAMRAGWCMSFTGACGRAFARAWGISDYVAATCAEAIPGDSRSYPDHCSLRTCEELAALYNALLPKKRFREVMRIGHKTR